MWRFGLFLCLVALVVGGPPVTKTREEIEAFRTFLENSRTDNGVRLSERMLANPNASAWENSGKFEGDIILDDWQVDALVQDFASGGSRNAYIWPNTRWPSNTIIYEFGAGEFNAQQQQAIMNSIHNIERNTCIRFRRRTNEFSFVRLTGRPDGCYAHVGFWASRGVHILNLARDTPGRGCFIPTTIIHEWLHIIGFFHMQSTYNRYNYVRIMWENIIPSMRYNFERYGTNIVNNMGLPYEYASCMHYGPFSFTINGRPTIVALRNNAGAMGQTTHVTWWDWLRARRHYNCPGGWTDDIEEQPETMAEQQGNLLESETDIANEA